MNPKVLVIDDYQEHIDVLLAALEKDQCEARGAITPQNGLNIMIAWEPDLVIVDGLMEGKRAWQIAHEFLQMNPTYRPYMVALTGFRSTLQQRLCEECGYDEYITKPIDLSILLGWVNKTRHRMVHKYSN